VLLINPWFKPGVNEKVETVSTVSQKLSLVVWLKVPLLNGTFGIYPYKAT